MQKNNLGWLPSYCRPSCFLPRIQETRALFQHPPFVFSDFVARAMRFLASDEIRRMGLEFDPASTVPCKWKCSDESVFGVDLALYAYTGQYPFDKGRIGGVFNETSLGAAIHHGSINVDFGGSHVGYVPGPSGGSFGRIWRPARREYSTDCGYLCALIDPFRRVWEDAVDNILLFRPDGGEQVLVSIPNEYLQPSWSGQNVKLMVNLETLTLDEVVFDADKRHTHTRIGRSLFVASRQFLESLEREEATRFATPTPQPIGRNLTYHYFSIYDTNAEVDADGSPVQKLLVYMPLILSAKYTPQPLKAALVNTMLEHNRLTDTLRTGPYLDYSFVSFTGVFFDLWDEELGRYLNLFLPMGLTVKPRGRTRETELAPDETQEILRRMTPAEPMVPITGLLGDRDPAVTLRQFTFRPGYFART